MGDTICAVATAPGRSALAVIRLSGPLAHTAVATLLRRDLPPLRQMRLRTLYDAEDAALDSALVAVFAARESFTGEASAELHLHGAPVVAAAVLRALTSQPGVRLAEPGEFTRRALEAGRLDLAQVEGLGDLLAAETEAQRRQAFRVMQGALSGVVEGWRRDLVRARALVEATIDFADEDVPEEIPPAVPELVATVQAGLRREIEGALVAERIRDGFEVAIVGRPNAGKSSLLNALARREVAITSDRPGTTRDVIELRLDLGGLPVTMLDTAGLRDTPDVVEQVGVERALARARAADLRLFLLAPGETLADLPLQPGKEDLVLLTKSDLCPQPAAWPAVSAVNGSGLKELAAALTRRLGERAAGGGLAIRERQRRALVAAAEALARVQDGLHAGAMSAELVAEELRLGCTALEILLGRVDVEEILDEIFASFCLGK